MNFAAYLSILLLIRSDAFVGRHQQRHKQQQYFSSDQHKKDAFSRPSHVLLGTATSTTEEGDVSNTQQHQKIRRVALLLFPAQFCVPADYQELWDNLPDVIDVSDEETGSELSAAATTTTRIVIDKKLSRVVPLSRRDWIKVAKQLPTENFLKAQLRNYETLDWYFNAVQEGLAQILADDSNSNRNKSDSENNDNGPLSIALVGHSIGGWVARAFLGGLSRSSTAISQVAQDRISSLITLGTPHISPETALVDQTRGLLREIDETLECSSKSLIEDRGIDVTCVCSSSLAGTFLTTNIEEFVAASSYLPLLGITNGETKGDGIVPLELAFMEEPARKVVVDACLSTGRPVRHSHVVPTPWELLDGSTPSIRLPDDAAVSYIAPGIVSQWAKFIR